MLPNSLLSESITNPNVNEKTSIHRAASTTSTVTLSGIPIKDQYKPIEALKFFEGKQRCPCINCKSDTCQQLFIFGKCTSLNSPPHWANTCPQIAQCQESPSSSSSRHKRRKGYGFYSIGWIT